MRAFLQTITFGALALWFTAAIAGADAQFHKLLTGSEPPAGVVIELVSGNQDHLGDVLPRIHDYQMRLREKFPGLPVAVVSHGLEQFSLMADQAKERGELFKLSEELVNNENVELHVCGGHARMRGVGTDTFASFVDVAPSGPAQIREYQKMGYVLIIM